MAGKHTNGRALKRGKPEAGLSPGEAVILEQHGGKVFELRRIDTDTTSMNAGLDRLFAEMPPEGERMHTDLARIIVEDRE